MHGSLGRHPGLGEAVDLAGKRLGYEKYRKEVFDRVYGQFGAA